MPQTPKSLGKIHDVFSDRLDELVLQANEQATVAGSTGRPWQVPTELETSLFNIPVMHEPAFNRDEINTNFEDCTKSADNPGTIGDVSSLMTQCDYVAMEERAFRTRHMSSIRAMAHANARRTGHGQARGVFGGVKKFAEDLIHAGGS